MKVHAVDPLSTDWYRCAKCKTSYFVKSDDPDRRLLDSKIRCPKFPACPGSLIRKSFTTKTDVIEKSNWTTALELYQASAGIGLAKERKCSPTDIKKALVGARVKGVHLETAPDPQKSIIMSLTLDNGKTIHLATSTKGAVIYKVTEVANGR